MVQTVLENSHHFTPELANHLGPQSTVEYNTKLLRGRLQAAGILRLTDYIGSPQFQGMSTAQENMSDLFMQLAWVWGRVLAQISHCMKVARLLLEPTQLWKHFSSALEVWINNLYQKDHNEEKVCAERCHVGALGHCMVNLQPRYTAPM